jgi:hypothetical protein
MIDFVRVEAEVNRLKQQVAAGEIDEATFEARLMDMVDIGEDGYYWMYGHKTGQWYRHDGHKWHVASPPEPKGEPVQVTWDSLDHVWFIFSLVVMAVIAAIVYSSVI